MNDREGGVIRPFVGLGSNHVRLPGRQYHLGTMTETLRFERAFPLPSSSGKIELKIQQGGAGRFYIIVTLPSEPTSNQITLSVPSELADSLTHAIGKAADYSGE